MFDSQSIHFAMLLWTARKLPVGVGPAARTPCAAEISCFRQAANFTYKTYI